MHDDRPLLFLITYSAQKPARLEKALGDMDAKQIGGAAWLHRCEPQNTAADIVSGLAPTLTSDGDSLVVARITSNDLAWHPRREGGAAEIERVFYGIS